MVTASTAPNTISGKRLDGHRRAGSVSVGAGLLAAGRGPVRKDGRVPAARSARGSKLRAETRTYNHPMTQVRTMTLSAQA